MIISFNHNQIHPSFQVQRPSSPCFQDTDPTTNIKSIAQFCSHTPYLQALPCPFTSSHVRPSWHVRNSYSIWSAADDKHLGNNATDGVLRAHTSSHSPGSAGITAAQNSKSLFLTIKQASVTSYMKGTYPKNSTMSFLWNHWPEDGWRGGRL